MDLRKMLNPQPNAHAREATPPGRYAPSTAGPSSDHVRLPAIESSLRAADYLSISPDSSGKVPSNIRMPHSLLPGPRPTRARESYHSGPAPHSSQHHGNQAPPPSNTGRGKAPIKSFRRGPSSLAPYSPEVITQGRRLATGGNTNGRPEYSANAPTRNRPAQPASTGVTTKEVSSGRDECNAFYGLNARWNAAKNQWQVFIKSGSEDATVYISEDVPVTMDHLKEIYGVCNMPRNTGDLQAADRAALDSFLSTNKRRWRRCTLSNSLLPFFWVERVKGVFYLRIVPSLPLVEASPLNGKKASLPDKITSTP